MTTQLIDATSLAPAIRHPRIFETFDALGVGDSLVLENDHYPMPLLYQFQAERPRQFDWSVLSPGPRFRVQITKRDASQPRGASEHLGWDHARLDALFDAKRMDEFVYGLERHITFEETLLFPLFEARAGARGPIAVMRLEHAHIREALRALLVEATRDEAIETLAALLGEHNAKEERVLYPLFDEMTSDGEREDMIRRMQTMPP